VPDRNFREALEVSAKTARFEQMKPWQRLTGIFLLVLFLHNLGGYYWVYHFLRRQAKSEMKAYIRKNHGNDPGVSVFSEEQSKDFEWIEDHEFRYRGMMYDIVKTEERNGKKYFHCVKDEREEELISAFLDIRMIMEEADEETEPIKQWIKKFEKELGWPVKLGLNGSYPGKISMMPSSVPMVDPGYADIQFPPPKV